MAVLENPRSNPGLARAIVRHLVACGGSAARVDVLRAVAPPGAGEYEPGTEGDARDETVAVCRALGLFSVDEHGTLAIALPQDQWDTADTVPKFRALVRTLLFERVRDIDPFAGSGLATFAGAIAWFLAQDPLKPVHGWGTTSTRGQDPEALQSTNLGHANRLLLNDYQWRAFTRWSLFLGFAAAIRAHRRPPDLVSPDPTIAIADELKMLSGSNALEKLAELALAIPVVDGGTIRKSVETRWRGEAPPQSVSPTTSFALKCLELGGKLSLHNVPDAAAGTRVVLHLGNEHVTISDIRQVA